MKYLGRPNRQALNNISGMTLSTHPRADGILVPADVVTWSESKGTYSSVLAHSPQSQGFEESGNKHKSAPAHSVDGLAVEVPVSASGSTAPSDRQDWGPGKSMVLSATAFMLIFGIFGQARQVAVSADTQRVKVSPKVVAPSGFRQKTVNPTSSGEIAWFHIFEPRAGGFRTYSRESAGASPPPVQFPSAPPEN
ncbi:hypothetical protein [Pararobbsia alpina]|uniref:Uncharacterized protein n=1 Tax=Pararobbsia alpina TaxID=621374 RepID=A0A6S7BM32_9BURK|nr:hypothetical protein [Pararobbsia alpina]CAB3805553.1 hypothetical protein LMG28138_05676 [Pararobbsia alpina]